MIPPSSPGSHPDVAAAIHQVPAVCQPLALVLFTSHCWWPQQLCEVGRRQRDGRKQGWEPSLMQQPRGSVTARPEPGIPEGPLLSLQQAPGVKPRQPAGPRLLSPAWRRGGRGRFSLSQAKWEAPGLCPAWGGCFAFAGVGVRGRWQNLRAALPLFLRESFPMILVANKVDLMHLRKITRDQGKEMATKHNVGRVCVCVCVGTQGTYNS